MTDPDDPGPEGGRAVAGRLVYDPGFATVSEEEFNELVALMRDGAPRKPPTPGALWRRAYHEAMFNLRLVGVQHDLFGAKPTTHMHKAKPGPVLDWILAARRKPVGSVTRRGILSGHWDQGNVVGAFRNGRGTFKFDQV